jgi:hypothetical protein
MFFLGGVRYFWIDDELMVPVGGLEPPSREAVDFESTEFTISPHGHI